MGTKVRLNTIYANAKGVAAPGTVIEVESTEAKDLVDGGYATAIHAPAQVAKKSAKAAKIEAAEIELAEAKDEESKSLTALDGPADENKAAAQAELDAARARVASAEAALDKLNK